MVVDGVKRAENNYKKLVTLQYTYDIPDSLPLHTLLPVVARKVLVSGRGRSSHIMEAVIRESPFGQLVRLVTKNKYFQYPEEKADFKLPDPWVKVMDGSDAEAGSEDAQTEAQTPTQHRNSDESLSHVTAQYSLPFTEARLQADEQHDIEKVKSIPITPKKTKDGAILVDWYHTDDAENPHNWSNLKRALIATIICLYTFVVYTTSAIYTSSEGGIIAEFGVSEVLATLGLSLYVLGYGMGPLLFSPMGEIPIIGRNPIYIVTMFLFVIISIPTAFVGNFPGLMVLRFLQGFFGSPCLASGGASIGDMYSLMSLPYALMAWVAAAYCGRKSSPQIFPFSFLGPNGMI
jgi:DHA1 family multidrug resistance protein-like MFS transporter